MYTTWVSQILRTTLSTWTSAKTPNRHHKLTALVALVMGFNVPVTTVSAQPVEATLANGRTVTAEFLAGEIADKDAIIGHVVSSYRQVSRTARAVGGRLQPRS